MAKIFSLIFLILCVKSYAQEFKANAQFDKNTYLDSIQTTNPKHTKITIGQTIFGGVPLYNYKKQQSFYILPLIDVFQYNTVEGFVINLNSSYTKYLSKKRFIAIKPEFRYGFGNNRFQSKVSFEHYYNPLHLASITLSGGKFIEPINTINSKDIFINTYSTLLLERNFLKLYENTFFKISNTFSPVKDFMISTNINWTKRNPLQNLSKIINGDNNFTSNIPKNNELRNTEFKTHESLLFDAKLSWQKNYKRIRSRGKFKSISKYPMLTLKYLIAIPSILKSSLSYQKISLQLKHRITYKNIGYGQLYSIAGGFISKDSLSFIDFKHFNGTRSVYTQFELEKFQLLNFFQYSTNDLYLESHYQHHFNGFLFKKIPLLKRTNMQSVFTINHLFTPTEKNYLELGIGVEKIRGKIRVDFYSSWRKNRFQSSAVRFGLVF